MRNFRPLLIPTVTTNDIAQGQHGIDMLSFPVHASAFQTSFDYQFIGTFHHPTPDGPILPLIVWILHLRFSLFQVGSILSQDLILRISLGQQIKLDQDPLGALVLE